MTLEVYVNLRRWGRFTVLATCDAELLGRILRDGKIVFEVKEGFYKGSKVSVEEAIELVRRCAVVNMVGKNIVRRAVQEGLVHPEAVLKISGVPHAQIVRM
ncbi:MAG: DUF424 domain-containing protein [Candidatus Bathyarchaeia archaeon]